MSGGTANRPAPSYAIDARGIVTWRRDGYEISTDRARIDLDVVHGYLVQSYWCANVTREHVARSIEHSLPLGLYAPDGSQVGFARLVTDRATFAWMSDVFVLEAIVRANGAVAAGVDDFLLKSQPGDYFVADPGLEHPALSHVRSLGSHALYQRAPLQDAGLITAIGGAAAPPARRPPTPPARAGRGS